jgi:hypothetical protein
MRAVVHTNHLQEKYTDSITKLLKTDSAKIFEKSNSLSVQPSSLVFKGLRQLPVVKCHHGGDAICNQLIDEVVVEVNSALVERGYKAIWEYARPGD